MNFDSLHKAFKETIPNSFSIKTRIPKQKILITTKTKTKLKGILKLKTRLMDLKYNPF